MWACGVCFQSNAADLLVLLGHLTEHVRDRTSLQYLRKFRVTLKKMSPSSPPHPGAYALNPLSHIVTKCENYCSTFIYFSKSRDSIHVYVLWLHFSPDVVSSERLLCRCRWQ